jgi:hypothetical protein
MDAVSIALGCLTIVSDTIVNIALPDHCARYKITIVNLTIVPDTIVKITIPGHYASYVQ